MDKTYHHGNLQIELLEEGLNFLHEEGMRNFSLRKLAKRVGVSPTACYNHYPNVDAIIYEMKAYVTKKFVEVLKEGAKSDKAEFATINMGKAYVNFFAENPHYFSYIYDNGDYFISLNDDTFNGDYEPFRVFKELSIACMRRCKIPEDKHLHNLVVMWATVHGLAAMANMKGFHYDGDWSELTETILYTKIIMK